MCDYIKNEKVSGAIAKFTYIVFEGREHYTHGRL